MLITTLQRSVWDKALYKRKWEEKLKIEADRIGFTLWTYSIFNIWWFLGLFIRIINPVPRVSPTLWTWLLYFIQQNIKGASFEVFGTILVILIPVQTDKRINRISVSYRTRFQIFLLRGGVAKWLGRLPGLVLSGVRPRVRVPLWPLWFRFYGSHAL